MLVLTRKAGQSLIIGDNITVRILEIKGDSIKIGIEAPREILIHREEVYEAIKKENQAAANVGKDVLSSLPKKAGR